MYVDFQSKFCQKKDNRWLQNPAKGMDMGEHPLINWLVLKLTKIYIFIFHCCLNPSICLFVLLDKQILTFNIQQLGEAWENLFLSANNMRYTIVLFFRSIESKGYVLRCLYRRWYVSCFVGTFVLSIATPLYMVGSVRNNKLF